MQDLQLQVKRSSKPLQMRDGINVYTVCYEPLGKCKGYIQVLHGMLEHTGRYDEMMSYFASLGYIVFAHDQRAHGHTANDQLGIVDNSMYYEEDAQAVRAHYVKDRAQRYILFGHSMGSFIARQLVLTDDTIQEAIIASTGCPPRLAVRAGKTIAKYRDKQQDNLLSKLTFLGFNRKFEGVTDVDWLSSDTKAVERYVADEMTGAVANSRFHEELFSLIERMYHNERNLSHQKRILFLGGTEDPVGKEGRDIRHLAKRYAKYNDVTLYMMENARHELLHERAKASVYAVMESWLQNE
ncbi:alpha/beta hydrolase [Savagea sp. SN6]|uniref:Alpha/beta hydrolase n=1 Tax=Savagea serpentis TaxID=2785297 RepID=A0A8J7KKI2_9BACL|nr:alpha/beta hydrolase [Savagea serpentis]MBF4500014.1 alpha/beta hydrolase [Savagea serpentis]